MGKWDQGEYNRVCHDKFKRLFYISQGKAAVDYDIEVEKNWKIFIRNLDVEKKTVQACFTSLVSARTRGDPRLQQQPRAGPSVHLPRAHRHYDTSDTRHGWQPPPPPAVYRPGDLWRDLPSGESNIPPIPPRTSSLRGLDIGPRPEIRYPAPPGGERSRVETIALAPGLTHDDMMSRSSNLATTGPELFQPEPIDVPPGIRDLNIMYGLPVFPPIVPLSGAELAQREISDQIALHAEIRRDRLEHPYVLQEGQLFPHHDHLFAVAPSPRSSSLHYVPVRSPFSPQPLATDDADTPVSLSGVRGVSGYDRRPRRIIRRSISPNESDDNEGVDGVDYDFVETYPLFAPLDDLGPLPADNPLEMFGGESDDDDDDRDDVELSAIHYNNPRPPRLEAGYTDWTPVAGLTLRPFPSYDPVIEYNQRARQAVDAQVASDRATTAPLNPAESSTSRTSVPAWAESHLGRRRREFLEEPLDAGDEGFGSFLRRVRPRTGDESEQTYPPPTTAEVPAELSEGRPQRVRLSMPPASLVSGENYDNRRNGVVFDAESYINPDL